MEQLDFFDFQDHHGFKQSESPRQDEVEKAERDFHFILSDFDSLVKSWGIETVSEYMYKYFNSTYNEVQKYMSSTATNVSKR